MSCFKSKLGCYSIVICLLDYPTALRFVTLHDETRDSARSFAITTERVLALAFALVRLDSIDRCNKACHSMGAAAPTRETLALNIIVQITARSRNTL